MSQVYTAMPFVQQFFWDTRTGRPLTGGKLYFYAAGTTTPMDTFQGSSSLAPANSNPLTLNAAGEPAVGIFWQATSYDVICKASDGVQMWSISGIPSTGLNQSIVGVGGTLFQFGGCEYTPITATSYPSGTSFQTCHADTTTWAINSSLLVGEFALMGMVYGTSGATVTAALVNLSDGSPDTPLVEISSASTTGVSVTSSAIPFAAGGSAKTYAIKTKASSSANRGPAFEIKVVRTA